MLPDSLDALRRGSLRPDTDSASRAFPACVPRECAIEVGAPMWSIRKRMSEASNNYRIEKGVWGDFSSRKVAHDTLEDRDRAFGGNQQAARLVDDLALLR